MDYDVKKINSSGFGIDLIKGLIFNDAPKLTDFVTVKLKKIEDGDDEGDEDDEDEILPFYKNFLIIYLIEFAFLKFKPDGLAEYLKSIKVPDYARYASALIAIFRGI
jgi:hypothetical protein